MRQLFLLFALASIICTSQAATLLNFGGSTITNTLQNGATSAAQGQIRWGNIAYVDGQSVDLVATVVGGTYSAANLTANDTLRGGFGKINVNHSTYVEFKFSLVDSVNDTAVVASSWDFAIADIDLNGLGNPTESVSVISGLILESYTLSSQTELSITGLYPNITATATVAGVGGDNPSDPANLTALQEKRSILFTLSDTDSFILGLNTTSGGSGRNFLFSGEADFGDLGQTVVSAVPEPTALNLLAMGGILLALRRHRTT